MEATNEEVMNATEALTAVLKEVVALKVDSTSMAIVKENLASIKDDIKLLQSSMSAVKDNLASVKDDIKLLQPNMVHLQERE